MCQDLLDFSAEHAKTYDVIVMTELIEHVSDLFGLLAAAKRCLRNGGKMIVTTPNIDSLPAGALWISDAPPVHYWSFSPASFSAVASRLGLRADFIDLRPSGLDCPPESFLRLDHAKPRTSPSFDSQGRVLRGRSKSAAFRTAVDGALAGMGMLRMARQAKAGIRSLLAPRRFGGTPSTLCVQLSP